ncbi:PQQ enzyme repeat-containing protein [Chitinophaga sp. YR627]|uniref:PQQ-binding-like beta-propeller repeat protein n=1 Tax=Chitinophaga sp. YR627 TaxID=1881041 RepID=UPI0008F2F938|nr:PQQ-binding-like beta-propeller repeat protein [Chitinophaga sp. YR627]SFM91545.1 PQQ enzyme repeat-containing protein [Chitinophaga sp. YR627]
MKLLKTLPEHVHILRDFRGRLYTTIMEDDGVRWSAAISNLSINRLFPENRELYHSGTTDDGIMIFQRSESLLHRKPSVNQITLFDTATGIWSEPHAADIVLYGTALGGNEYNGIRLNHTGNSFVIYDAIANKDCLQLDFDNLIWCTYGDNDKILLTEHTRKEDLFIYRYSRDGQRLWSVKIDDVLTGGIVSNERRATIVNYLPVSNLFVFCYPGCVLFALDAVTGEKKWEYQVEMPRPYSVVPDEDDLIYITRTAFDRNTKVNVPWLTVLDGRNGTLVLEKDLSTTVFDEPVPAGFYEVKIAVLNAFLYLTIPQLGKLFKLDKNTGTLIDSYSHTKSFQRDTAMQDGHLILLEDNDSYNKVLVIEL